MAKKTEISVPAPVVEENNPMLLSKPEFLQGQEAVGTDLLRQYVVPPRLKIVQPLTKKPLSDMFREGECVALPTNDLIDSIWEGNKKMDASEGIIFVPIFFYVEWLTVNPREMSDLSFIRDRSFDPTSQIAAKSRTPATRKEKCPENPKYEIQHMEVFNYLISIQSASPLGREPVLLSFSKAEHRTGTILNSMVKLRKAPIYGCQFKAVIVKRENAQGHWYAFDVMNPPEGISPWVATQELCNEYGRAHAELQAAYDKQLIRADYDEPADDQAGGDVNPEM